MRISRFIAPALLALTIAACSKDDDPTAPTAAQIAKLAGANLQTLSTKISDPQVKAAAKLAGGMLINGAPFTEFTMSTTASAARNRDAAINARLSAEITTASETWSGTAIQVVITNSAAANGAYNIIIAWKGESDVVFVGAPNSLSSATIGTTGSGAFGGLFTAPSASWQATAGNAAISNASVGSACAGFVSATGVTCKNASFNGGFGITASTPFSATGNTATGSRTAALASRSFAGIQVTVDCSVYSC